MRLMKILLPAIVLILSYASLGFGQLREAERPKTDPASSPNSYRVRYEGGVFGLSSKEKGDLKFDDGNQRVVFYRLDNKEMFAIPYESLVMVFPSSKDELPQSGNVMSRMPLPGAGLFGLMSKSTKYAILNFNDPDIEAKGIASFRFDDKKMLLSFINKLGAKSKLTQRGDAYYRAKRATY